MQKRESLVRPFFDLSVCINNWPAPSALSLQVEPIFAHYLRVSPRFLAEKRACLLKMRLKMQFPTQFTTCEDYSCEKERINEHEQSVHKFKQCR